MGINKGYLTAKTDKESDEVFTPKYAVLPLLKYLKPNSKIWCPFDDENSEYVQTFRENGHAVIYSHIDRGQNFFEYLPDENEYDIIISNPPFSIKDQVLERLINLQKPFAVLFPLPTLQGQKRFPYLLETQALVFDKRINFFKNIETKEILKGVSFASIYICKHFLPKDLIFEKLDVK